MLCIYCEMKLKFLISQTPLQIMRTFIPKAALLLTLQCKPASSRKCGQHCCLDSAVKSGKMLVWCFAEGMDQPAGPTAGNEGSMECYAPTESLKRGKNRNILMTETPGKMNMGLHTTKIRTLFCRWCRHGDVKLTYFDHGCVVSPLGVFCVQLQDAWEHRASVSLWRQTHRLG